MKETTSLSAAQPLLALRSQETGDLHKLSGEVLIGREVECDIQLRSIQVSRYHAKIIVAANAIFIEDLQSSNGTFVTGVPVKRRTEIGLGDQIGFDDVVFRVTSFHSGGADATEMASKNNGSALHSRGDISSSDMSADRPAVEELIKHRDQKPVPLDLTQRKSDLHPSAPDGMTIARAPIVPPAAYERSLAAQQKRATGGVEGANSGGARIERSKDKRLKGERAKGVRSSSEAFDKNADAKNNNANKIIIAGLLIILLVLALFAVLFK